MRSTLPLTSFPLHLLLTCDWYYTLLQYLACSLLMLFKCYNLPYGSAMSAQETLLLVFVLPAEHAEDLGGQDQ